MTPRTGVVRSSALGTTWSARHHLAMQQPNEQERPLVLVLQCIPALVELHGSDYVTRDGVADIIKGAQRLLVGQWGDNLDRGTVDRFLNEQAARMGYSLDVEEFTD